MFDVVLGILIELDSAGCICRRVEIYIAASMIVVTACQWLALPCTYYSELLCSPSQMK